MDDFTFSRPGSLDKAAAALEAAEDGLYLAGGQTIIPVMKQGLAMPTALIDLAGIAELRGISVADGTVSIGAMMRHAEVAASTDVERAIPALADLAGGIGDAQVRNRGTIGGSLANNDPSADYPAAVLGLDATVYTDRRAIAADDFFRGLFETALEEGELITRVVFPVPERAAYAKFPNPASRYALAGVFVSRLNGGVRVAVTGAGAGVFRVPDMEDALAGDFSPSALKGLAVSADDMNTDMHGSAEYRAHIVSVMAKRAVARANGEAAAS